MNILKQVQDLSKKISGKIYFEYNMKHLSWFNLGGSAKIFFKPNTLDELIIFLKEFANTLPIKVLGFGSNTLIRDGGYNGIIIKLGKNFSHLSKLDDNTLVAGSSASDKQLSQFAQENSISGFEFFSCIPGSVGGAIKMNSGCYDYDVSKCIASIQAINYDGIVRSIKSEKINFFYRGSDLSNDLIFLSATFKGQKEDRKKIKKITKKFEEIKKKSQPSKIKTCGSTFKNPISQTRKKAWELIREASCENMVIGGTSISSKHSNFFVNENSATSNDMENLINQVQEKVLRVTGIKLELELQIIGEKNK
jgi:UDP-N-acetylmuramate dehydrogenase